ncbi:hypothetical protein LOK49_LG04G02511 [Camellia lanceoleosa]|uniref:Uncharacterized protein n=1 Tax=Camellia lanceoleosa TaxID=1840588 RepID=A0ACC0I4T5_9ERIC|nr:hypothetical protein LOK49_LG04G02511 [Camellia lanceoleosa]
MVSFLLRGSLARATRSTNMNSQSSDEEDGGDRKKLRLSKDQSAVLEKSLKLNTLNPITQAKDGKPVTIELINAKTKEPKDTSEVDAALIATGRGPFTKGLGLENINVVTQRGFVLVDERMQVIDANGNLRCSLHIVVEQVSGKDHVLNHLSIPAACFTHLEISNGWTHSLKRRRELK